MLGFLLTRGLAGVIGLVDEIGEIEMNKATYIRNLSNWNGIARLYKVEPPLMGEDFVIVSAVRPNSEEPETYIFGCDESDKYGNEVVLAELPGSFRGALDHEEALRRAGYEIERV